MLTSKNNVLKKKKMLDLNPSAVKPADYIASEFTSE